MFLSTTDIFHACIKIGLNLPRTARGTGLPESRQYDFRQPDIHQWRKSTVFSPITPLYLRQLARVHLTFASITYGISPVGDCPTYFRQSTPSTFAKRNRAHIRIRRLALNTAKIDSRKKHSVTSYNQAMIH